MVTANTRNTPPRTISDARAIVESRRERTEDSEERSNSEILSPENESAAYREMPEVLLQCYLRHTSVDIGGCVDRNGSEIIESVGKYIRGGPNAAGRSKSSIEAVTRRISDRNSRFVTGFRNRLDFQSVRAE